MRKLILVGILCLMSSASYAQTILYDLKQVKQSGTYCHLIFDIYNNTNNNITQMATYLLFRESSGSVIDDAMTGFIRIKPKSVTTEQVSLSDVNCRIVKSFQFKSLWGGMIKIDGEAKHGRNVESIIQGIQVKSSVSGISARN